MVGRWKSIIACLVMGSAPAENLVTLDDNREYWFMTNPLISCIVPVFNGERYVAEALDSILAQTYGPIEVVVIDDRSTDGTRRLVTFYAEQVRYLWQPNSGPPRARNFGLSVAKGEFIAFLDADDLWQPKKLSLQMACFRERPELDFCVTHCQVFWIPELHEEEM